MFIAGLGKRLTALDRGLKFGAGRDFHYFYWSSGENDTCGLKSRRAGSQLDLRACEQTERRNSEVFVCED